MKKLIILCLSLVMCAGVATAQNKDAKKKAVVTTVFATDIDCDHCAQKIMNNVPALGKGIKDVKIDIPTKQVTVTYDAAKNTEENIVKGFASIKVKAEPQKEQKK